MSLTLLNLIVEFSGKASILCALFEGTVFEGESKAALDVTAVLICVRIFLHLLMEGICTASMRRCFNLGLFMLGCVSASAIVRLNTDSVPLLAWCVCLGVVLILADLQGSPRQHRPPYLYACAVLGLTLFQLGVTCHEQWYCTLSNEKCDGLGYALLLKDASIPFFAAGMLAACTIAVGLARRTAASPRLCFVTPFRLASVMALILMLGGGYVQFAIQTEPPLAYSDRRYASQFLELLLVSEDPTFFFHRGVDLVRLRDAARETLTHGAYGRGGSTLSMQLAKVLYLKNEKSLFRKALQIVFALLLEAQFSKEVLLRAYVESVPYAPGVLGITAVCEHAYGISCEEMTDDQSLRAVLAIYDPLKPVLTAPLTDSDVQLRARTICSRHRVFSPTLEQQLQIFDK